MSTLGSFKRFGTSYFARRALSLSQLLNSALKFSAATGAFLDLTLHDLPPSCRSDAQPRHHLCSTNLDHVCCFLAPASCVAMSAERCTVSFHKPAIFLTSVLLQLASVAGSNVSCAQPQPSRVVRVVVQRFFFRGIGLRPLVSGFFMPRTSLCYFERTLHTALAKSMLAIPPHHPPSKMVHLQEDVEGSTGLVTRSSAVVAEGATHSCCLAYYLARSDCRFYLQAYR